MAPSDLPAPAAAEWQALAPELVKLGVLRASDLRALRLLAETLADVAQARAAVKEHGLVATSAAGTLKPNPAVKVLENARAQATRLLAEFGLTPRGRENVTTRAPSTGRNPFQL